MLCVYVPAPTEGMDNAGLDNAVLQHTPEEHMHKRGKLELKNKVSQHVRASQCDTEQLAPTCAAMGSSTLDLGLPGGGTHT